MRSTSRMSRRAIAGASLAAGIMAVTAVNPTGALANEADTPAPAEAPHDPATDTGATDTTGADPAAATSLQGLPTQDLPAAAVGAATELPSFDQAASAQQARKLSLQRRETALRSAVVALAKKQIGDRYIAGRSGPTSFDCSGLTKYVFAKVLGKSLPHYSRTQYSRVKHIPLKTAEPGDLVFYFRGGAHHVGIYVGGGRMVHAANPRRGVVLGSIGGPWYARSFTGIGRLIADA
jgi:cell wall-associated NlpC family hydrolase